eukprot:2148041-Rhodomonas_salina.1
MPYSQHAIQNHRMRQHTSSDFSPSVRIRELSSSLRQHPSLPPSVRVVPACMKPPHTLLTHHIKAAAPRSIGGNPGSQHFATPYLINARYDEDVAPLLRILHLFGAADPDADSGGPAQAQA